MEEEAVLVRQCYLTFQDIEAPLPEYKDKIEDSVRFLTTYDRNDAIGIIVREFDASNSFGIGHHYDCQSLLAK